MASALVAISISFFSSSIFKFTETISIYNTYNNYECNSRLPSDTEVMGATLSPKKQSRAPDSSRLGDWGNSDLEA